MNTKIKIYFLLFIILLLGFVLRTYNVNWDSGFHLHPDERAIVMATTPLHLPESWQEFFSVQSPLNPHFFAYGSFPMYFLRMLSFLLSGFFPLIQNYEQINILGRVISALFDTGTILLIFFLGKKIFRPRAGLLAGLFYALSVLPIQLSHFYAVDVMLTFFLMTTLFTLINFYSHPTGKKACLAGILFGCSLATKTSAIALIATIGCVLVIDFFLIFLKQPHKPHIWFPHIPRFLRRLFVYGFLIAFSAIVTFLLLEPYAWIDFQNFWSQNMQQAAMTKSAFIFPYTLQYVGKIPYWYEAKNIFLWGMGPILATVAFAGIIFLTSLAIKKRKQEFILMVFFWSYFLVVGKFAVGWIRYMLPIYPLLAIAAGVLLARMYISLPKYFARAFLACFLALLFLWTFSFLHIYTQPNTRVQATDWILKNIPAGKTLAIEHWDDSLPLINQQQYRMETLELYNPDTLEKWQKIDAQLQRSDYIIIASNRLYVPLQKLIDCEHLDRYHCYPLTEQYYKHLFYGENILESTAFQKIAEFAVYPTFPVLAIPINDQGADESFTVYDHPKVMIFKKI